MISAPDADAGPGRRGPWRRLVLVVAALLALGVPVPSASGSDVVGRPADGIFLVDGRGYGHGQGMSQHGAHGAGLRGLTHAQILTFYFPGTVLGTVSGVQRRVLLTGEDADLVATNAAGLRLRDTAGGAVVETGQRADWSAVRVRPVSGGLLGEALQSGAWVPVLGPVAGPVQAEGPATVQLHHPAGLRTYRGSLRAALSGSASRPLYVVNSVGLDDYVRGVVPAEMPTSWHEQALRAQAVAARSYGVLPCPQPQAYPATALYDVVDTTSCQVYTGIGPEAPRSNAAVTDTAGQVLRLNGTVLRTMFSSSNGGWTVASGPFPAREDPYDAVGAQAASSTVHRWSGVRVPATKLEAAFGTGQLSEVRVLSRDGNGEWGGRVLRVRLVGSTRTVEVSGAAVRFAVGLRSDWFDLVSVIDAKHLSLGGDTGLLGPAAGPESPLNGGRFRPYQRGLIYYSPPVGAHEVHGAILEAYARNGWEAGPLAYPITDEQVAPDARGRYSAFQRGSIYWTAATGAWAVRGAIRDTWARLGWEAGPLGYPITDELTVPDQVGRFTVFERGSIYWTPSTGAREVRGAIRSRWAALGWEAGHLGYPTTDELPTPNGRGRFNHFQAGSVYWSALTDAHEVRGAIRVRWVETGAESGTLGFPVSDEYAVPGGRRSDFERGSILFDAATGSTRVV